MTSGKKRKKIEQNQKLYDAKKKKRKTNERVKKCRKKTKINIPEISKNIEI